MEIQKVPGLRQRKQIQTASNLASAAFALFEEKGFEAVTMEEIALQANVAKGTLYNYFPVKEALLAHYFREEIAGSMAAMQQVLISQPSFRARMTALLLASAQWNRSRRPYLASYLRYRMAEIGNAPLSDADRSSGSYSILEALFRSAQAKGELRKDREPRELAWLFGYMTAGAVMVWLAQPEPDDLEARLLFALEVLLDGSAVEVNVTTAE